MRWLRRWIKLPTSGTSRRERRRAGKCRNKVPTQFCACGILFFHREVANHERIHARAEKRADGVGWRTDNRFATKVEGGIHDHWHASSLSEFMNQPPVERIHVALDRLRACASIHMSD